MVAPAQAAIRRRLRTVSSQARKSRSEGTHSPLPPAISSSSWLRAVSSVGRFLAMPELFVRLSRR